MKRNESYILPNKNVPGLPLDQVYRFLHIKKVGNGYEVRFERDECVLVLDNPEILAKAILLGLGFSSQLVERLIIPSGSMDDNWIRIFRDLLNDSFRSRNLDDPKDPSKPCFEYEDALDYITKSEGIRMPVDLISEEDIFSEFFRKSKSSEDWLKMAANCISMAKAKRRQFPNIDPKATR